jgi:hypothetical protein
MNVIATGRVRPSAPAKSKVVDHSVTIRHIRWLIWFYLWLLVFEGVFRKWIIPQLATPLLLVRDPVAIAIYVLAFRAKLIPQNVWIVTLELIAILSWATGVIVLLPYFPIKTIILVTGYGVRCNYLHLPLIFIMPMVFDIEDVKRVGRWTIVGMIPMSVLMAAQFASSPDSFINNTAGVGEGMQLGAGSGRIRPPGTFSFVSGAVYYLSAVAAFMLHAVLGKLPYKTWLLGVAGGALLVGMGVSGSRAAILAVGVVGASLAVIVLVRPMLAGKLGRYILLGAIVVWLISYLPVFREGVGILSDRFAEGADDAASSVVGSLVGRTFGDFYDGLLVLARAPLGGFGLGVGTNGGANFLVGHVEFLLAENEWSRIILESGPILGAAFLLWRCAITFYVGRFSLSQLRRDNPLPLFLFSASFFALLEGPFGQPTTLGFAVALAGLALAARPRVEEVPTKKADEREKLPARRPRRSVYAERLHEGWQQETHLTHDPLDR